MGSLRRGISHNKRHRVSIAHIFCRADNNAPRNKTHVLAAFQHLCQIMQRRVGVTAAHAFYKRRYRIVMAVALFIVTLKSVAHYAFKHRAVNRFYAVRQHKFCLLQQVQRHARVASAKISQCFQRLVRHGKPLPAVAVFLIRQRLLQNLFNGVFIKPLQTDNFHPRQKRSINFKKRVFRSCTDKNNRAVFHIRQKHILLSLVKAVYFVDKNYRTPHAAVQSVTRFANQLTQLRHAARYCIKRNKTALRHIGNNMCQCSFAGSRRPVKQKRLQSVTLNHPPQRAARSKGFFLPRKIA